MAKKQNKQNSFYRILVGIICKDSVKGILFILLFGHFMYKKTVKSCPKIGYFEPENEKSGLNQNSTSNIF